MPATGEKRNESHLQEDDDEPPIKRFRSQCQLEEVTNDSTLKTHGDYSIGWICALSKEQTAATAMLDVKHADLPKPHHDSNTYTLGSIGKHNVVIACLPEGKYGSNSAANVATLMAGTFPSVRSCLLVGIGGGVPSNKVRLGDVIVGIPQGQHPGVIQWDMGKSKQDSTFERIGVLDNPPKALLTALTKLKTEHELNGSKIPEYLDDFKIRYPKAAERYLKSSTLVDKLYRADYSHVTSPSFPEDARGGEYEHESEEEIDEQDDEEIACQFCDPSKIIKRAPRSMQVQYGLIASGNQVIKDAKFRDQLSHELGGKVLCVEMEAAGIANNLPCLVIRGICDYADSHKNDMWQEHVAAVAAAYAKELLSIVQPTEVRGDRLLKDVLEECRDLHTRVESVQKAIQGGFMDAQSNLNSLLEEKEAQRAKDVLNWLSDIDFAPQQSDYISSHEPGTGQRLLRSTEFVAWLEQNNQTLFCPGIPGAGKTIQASIVVEHLIDRFRNDSAVVVAYQYYNFQRHQYQKSELLVANLIKQLAQHQSSLPISVEELHTRHKNGSTRPSLQEYMDTLQIVASSYSQVFIVLDALDEYDNGNHGRSRFLDGLFNVQKNTGLNLLVTSRYVQDIEKRFAGHTLVAIRPSKDDVFKSLDRHMEQLPDFVQHDSTLKSEIKEKIASVIEGMFLLARLHVDSLAGKRSVAALRKALKDLRNASTVSKDGTSALDDAYEKAMERIQRQKGDMPSDAMTILSWILHSRRQLRVAELREALAVEIGKSELDPDNIPTVEHITRACAGLVVIDEESDIIRLVHYTTQEYLERVQKRWFKTSQANIAKTLITCLSFTASRSHRRPSIMVREDVEELHTLYRYAIDNWGHHAREALVHGTEAHFIILFLESDHNLEVASQAMSKEHIRFTNEPECSTALHVAAFFGLDIAISILLEKGHDASAQDEDGITPLWWAARMGHLSSVELLHSWGAGLHDKDTWFWRSPLFWAARNNHISVVELLLKDRVVIDSQDSEGTTALATASEEGNMGIVKLLLEHGAHPDSQTKESNLDQRVSEATGKPLFQALKNGHEDIVRLLLSYEASVNAKDENGLTPLVYAVRNGSLALTRLLLEHDAAVNIDGDEVLESAIQGGHKTIIKLVIGRGARFENLAMSREVDILGRRGDEPELVVSDGRTPFSWSVAPLHRNLSLRSEYVLGDQAPIRIRALQLIIRWGEVDIDAKDDHKRTPLSHAVEQNNTAAVKLLVASRRVELDSRDLDGRTPLSYCLSREMAAILLSTRAVNINTQDNSGRTPVSYAAEWGCVYVVRDLMRWHANTRLEDSSGQSPLAWAGSKMNIGRKPITGHYELFYGYDEVLVLLS